MGELYGNVEISQRFLIACTDLESCSSDLSDPFGISSSINGLFSNLWTLTAYISCRFFNFIEDLVSRDLNGWCSHYILVNSFEQYQGSSCHRSTSTSKIHSSFSRCHDDCDTTRVSGVGGSDFQEEVVVNKHSELVEANKSTNGNPIILQGLLRLPIHGIQFAWRLTVAPWKCIYSCIKCTQARVHSIALRVLRTLHGSSSEIGWLQNTPGMPPVVDGTARFLELLHGMRNGKHQLPNSFVYLLIPGLFSNHGPLYFVATKRFFSKMGLACHIAKIHSEASVEHNAWVLKLYIEELYWGSGKQVMILGHSKGGVDAAAALSLYWSDLEGKVAGLALVQSPYGGTPLASDILRDGQIADKETRRIMELIICKFIKGDIRALEDLTYERRRKFILKHQLPKKIPLVSFHSEASLAPGVLATMTHIAHAELPWLPLPRFMADEPDLCAETRCRVPVVVPVSAAMAICALHLQLRYGEKSDGLVTCRDAEVPGSVVVRPHWKLDHAWMVYSSNKKNPSEPDASDMSEALLALLVEIGKKMKEEEKS